MKASVGVGGYVEKEVPSNDGYDAADENENVYAGVDEDMNAGVEGYDAEEADMLNAGVEGYNKNNKHNITINQASA